MTAKQLLHDFVEGLSEDDAAVTAAMLIQGSARALRANERVAIERGLAEADGGELVPLEEIEREFGIN